MLDPQIIQRYAGLIFDMDGTLIDTMPAHEEAWRQTGEYFGYPLDGSLMYQLSGATTYTIAEAIMRAANMPLALGTGAHRAMTDLLVEKFRLQPYFEAIVTSDDVAAHKPAPDTFLRCAELLGVPADRTLVFEDGDFGIEAAHAAGMDAFDVRDNTLLKA
ncbi:HAD-IA family hydrolase [Testudinibacter sp. P27/CKL/0425]